MATAPLTTSKVVPSERIAARPRKENKLRAPLNEPDVKRLVKAKIPLVRLFMMILSLCYPEACLLLHLFVP